MHRARLPSCLRQVEAAQIMRSILRKSKAAVARGVLVVDLLHFVRLLSHLVLKRVDYTVALVGHGVLY